MTTRISYKRIDLKSPVRVFTGRTKVDEVTAVAGVTITRVIEPPLDFYVVEGGTAVPGLEIETSNVAAGERVKDAPALRGRGGKAKAADDEEA